MPENDRLALARALGRIPSGLFIVTSEKEGRPIGFVGSFVMQAGFEPPMLSVAVAKERGILDELRGARRFAVSVLDERSRRSMAPFVKRLAEGESPFDRLALSRTASGLVVLTEALAWVECRLVSEHATGDHVVLFGEVIDGGLTREGEPHIHLRKNGLAY